MAVATGEAPAADGGNVECQSFGASLRRVVDPVSGSVVLINFAGAIALLLFATRMVRTGVERAYGDLLRQKLRGTMRSPVLAVLAGGAL